jgi:hypothetical protein
MIQNYDFMSFLAFLELLHLGVLAVSVLIVKDSEQTMLSKYNVWQEKCLLCA